MLDLLDQGRYQSYWLSRALLLDEQYASRIGRSMVIALGRAF